MSNSITTYGLREIIGLKKSFKDLGLSTTLTPESGFGFKEENPDYIEPFLKKLSGNTNGHPQVILISAAGATGKTQMCKHLSSKLNIPVLDLGISGPVAVNSLSGTLLKALRPSGYANYVTLLELGQEALIIDALDEGLVKTGNSPYMAFIEDVRDFTFPGVTTIIMLGRTQTLELTSRMLDNLNVEWVMYQISSFSEQQASEYIDKKVKPNSKFEKPYRQLKEEIFKNLNSFFREQSQLKTSFLGYAPVLDAISRAIKLEGDYNSMYQRIKEKYQTGMTYVVDIMRELTKREKNDKINPLIENFRKDLTDDEFEVAIRNNYDDLEQCQAVMADIYNEIFDCRISASCTVNDRFIELLQPFVKQHPFLNNGKFQNIVFEAYVLSRLIHDDPENIYMQLYLGDKYKPTFMLFYMYTELYNESKILTDFVSPLYRSLISFDNAENIGSCDLQELDEASGEHILVLEREQDATKASFIFDQQISRQFDLGSIVSNITINSSKLELKLINKANEIVAPSNIYVTELTLGGELVISPSPISEATIDQHNQVNVDVKELNASYDYGQPKLNIVSNNVNMEIYASHPLMPPFKSFQVNAPLAPAEFTEEMNEIYTKLRKILISFRSHSKGTMARCKGKIDSARISGAKDGEEIITALIKKGVIIDTDNIMYFLDRDKTASVLGLTFDKLKSTNLTTEMKKFIEEYVETHSKKK